MKTYILKEPPPFDRKAEREPRHGRQEQQPKRPKRPPEANRLAPRSGASQREWSRKQHHKGCPQSQCCCHHRHCASDASVAAPPVHVTVFRWTNNSPGSKPTISLADPRLSEHAIQRYSGDCCRESLPKKSRCCRLMRSTQVRLFSKR